MAAQRASTSLLDQETDARFWLQTLYKVGRKLDMRDPSDQTWAHVWADFRRKVADEDRSGQLRVTYNDPRVQFWIKHATDLEALAAARLAAAQIAQDPATRDAHARAAAQAAQAASEAARAGRVHQPPTVSPVVVQAAADQTARDSGRPPPPSAVSSLPPTHPAMSSPRAQPATPPPAPPPVVLAPPVPAPEVLPAGPATGPVGPHGPPDPATPPPAPDPLATARALAAPALSAQVHLDAHVRESAGAPPPRGTTSSEWLAWARGEAQSRGQAGPAPASGVVLAVDGTWRVQGTSSAEEARSWYHQLLDAPTAFQYAAYYDRRDPAWPAPAEETLGTREPLPGRGETRPASGWSGTQIAVGSAVLLGVGFLAARAWGGGQ